MEGLSIGWADTYDASLPGQSLAVAGLPAGNYCLISRADPVNRIDELSDTNNNRRTRLHLDPAGRRRADARGPLPVRRVGACATLRAPGRRAPPEAACRAPSVN